MCLTTLFVFVFVLTSIGSLMMLWAVVDMRRGFNFSRNWGEVQGRWTNVFSREEAPVRFWYAVLLKVALGAMLYGNAVYTAVLWLPE